MIGKTASRAEYTNAGVHVVKVGNLTGRGIQWGCVERQFVQPNWVKRYALAVLQEKDILFTAAAYGPKWIGLKVDVFTHVPPRYGKEAVYCAEIMRVRVNPEMEIDPLYVLTFLRSAAGYAEIQRCIRGQSGHVYREQVQEIRIPKPDKGTIKRVADAIEALTRSLKSQDDTQIALAEADALAAQLFPSSVRKPIIAR